MIYESVADGDVQNTHQTTGNPEVCIESSYLDYRWPAAAAQADDEEGVAMTEAKSEELCPVELIRKNVPYIRLHNDRKMPKVRIVSHELGCFSIVYEQCLL